jgi:6-phosphogluconolactonase
MHHWHIYPTPTETAHACAAFIAELIRECLQNQSQCHVALPGGNTPAMCFAHLTKENLDWKNIHWYPGDERCLPVGHKDRNDSMMREHLWSKISVPEKNIHIIDAELGAEMAAQKFGEQFGSVHLDIALLGMGEDGHTASLFPGNPALTLTDFAVPVHHAPKPPPDRVSLGINTLHAAQHRIVLTTGEGKRDALRRIRAGEPLPVNRIGDCHWFIDQAASG